MAVLGVDGSVLIVAPEVFSVYALQPMELKARTFAYTTSLMVRAKSLLRVRKDT